MTTTKPAALDRLLRIFTDVRAGESGTALLLGLRSALTPLLLMGAASVSIAANGDVTAEPDCARLPVSVVATPTEATLSWPWPGGAHHYWVEGGCPAIAGRSCTSRVEVVAPLAYPGVVVADPTRATCETQRGVAFGGRAIGPSLDEPAEALDADDCCQQCARAVPARPYREPCLFFVFDEETKRCSLLRENLGRTPRSSAMSGRVVAWPGWDDGLRKP